MARSAAWIAAAAVIAPLAGRADVGSMCWRDGYDAERCCTQQDPTCWDAVFTAARCCPEGSPGARAPRGNPRCWLDGYTYEDCCVSVPKRGCWDSDYGPELCCRDPSASELDRPRHATEEEMTDAYVRYTAAAADGPLECEDDPPGLWRVVKVASAALNVSRQHGMPGQRPVQKQFDVIQRHVLSWARDRGAWEAGKRACPAGALNAIDITVASIEREVGEDEAKKVYRLHQELQSELARGGAGPRPPGWRALGEGYEYVPRLLGLAGGHRCHQSSLRIFVYRIPKFSHMVRPVLTCSQKMSQCTASVHIHRWLESGSCITDDPEEADLFFLPAYEACYNETACGFGNDTERCFPQDFDPALDLPYFQRRGGADHFFSFACNLLPFRDPLMVSARQSIMVTVESYQAENFAGPNMFAWFSHWKDVLIPGYIPQWRISAMLTFNKPMIQRPTLLTFHGHSASSPNVGHMYRRSPLASVRDRVIGAFWNMTGASVGPPVRDYFRRMGMSRFCLVPAGLTAWTIHLYEAFFFGCVPVILSDELTVPFQDEIDWPSLSLHVPTTMDMQELYDKLSSYSLGQLKEMYRGLAAARCWFDYSRGWGAEGGRADGCSPYRGLLTALEGRARRRGEPYRLGPFWEPPLET